MGNIDCAAYRLRHPGSTLVAGSVHGFAGLIRWSILGSAWLTWWMLKLSFWMVAAMFFYAPRAGWRAWVTYDRSVNGPRTATGRRWNTPRPTARHGRHFR